MRDRIRFDTELLDLGLRDPTQQSSATPLFELWTELPEPYNVRGGLYSRDQVKKEIGAGGIILTANTTGKEEDRLALRAPFTITINKELSRAENNRFDRWVSRYNGFALQFEEVLRAIGRLRDLLSVGAPEEPKHMTSIQKASVWRKPGTQTKADKKTKYRLWRAAPSSAQAIYLATVADLPASARSVDEARQAYWRALGVFERTMEEIKRLKKPEFEDAFPSFADLIGIVTAGSVKAGTATLFMVGADWYLEVRKRRKEYDEKLAEFKRKVRNFKDIKAEDFTELEKAADGFWQKKWLHERMLTKCEYYRKESRQQAALFAEALRPNSSDSINRELRMVPLVSDAWHVLAKIAPKALKSLNAVLKERAFMQWAKLRYQRRPDPYGAEEITKVLLAFDRANSWKGVLNEDSVKGWAAKDALWEKIWFNWNV